MNNFEELLNIIKDYESIHKLYDKDYFIKYKKYYKNILANLPEGRVYNKAFQDNSNLNIVIKILGEYYENIFEYLNNNFKGLFPSQSNFSLEQNMKDLGIPNEIFYLSEDNIIDVFVLKYLSKDESNYNIQRVINAYGVRCKITDQPGLRTKIILYSSVASSRYTKELVEGRYIYTPIYKFNYGGEQKFRKFRYLINEIKPIYTRIDWEIAENDQDIKEYKNDPEEPDFISLKINNKYVEKLLV